MSVKCFWMEPTGEVMVEFGRSSYDKPCTRIADGYHHSEIALRMTAEEAKDVDYDHPALQQNCPCGYVFGQVDPGADDGWIIHRPLYRRADTNEEYTASNAPAGAMYDAAYDWAADYGLTSRGADGRSLSVKLPNNHWWMVDGRASNCTEPCANCGVEYKDHWGEGKVCKEYAPRDKGAHRCWIRHGVAPMLTVDKAAGLNGASAATTCGAGAGSIQSADYHGYLQDGVLT